MTPLDEYDYHLPRDLIAQHPPPSRSDARLLVVDRRDQSITHAHICGLGDFFRRGDCLVINDTKVLRARLVGYRTRTRGRWEGLFLSAQEHGVWKVLSKTRGKLQPGETITLEDRHGDAAAGGPGGTFAGGPVGQEPRLQMLANLGGGMWAARPQAPCADPLELLDRVGRAPLPHYIRGGDMVESDFERYQTVYAQRPGAVAAPTAGLHFTQSLLGRLLDLGVYIYKVTLHVGVGTFRPIETANVEDHSMHEEWGEISSSTAERLTERRAAGGRVFAVGTTTVRVLETAARSGCLIPWSGATNLFIRPPFQFHAVDALMTNFHLPRSTLLVLVRTFGGDDLIRQAYEQAIEQEYRFYSYGDAMLIL